MTTQHGEGPPPPAPADEVRERPARYHRSANGLLAALVVTVLVVVAFVVFRGAFRDLPTYDAGPLDLVEPVQAAQESGIELVYPRSLPEGWRVTSIDFVPGESPSWGIGMLTDDDRYVGLRQEDADADELVEAYVDEEAEPGDEDRFDSDLRTGPWQTWADAGGDLAFSTTLSGGARDVVGETVLVYGSASRDDQERLISLLTLDPVG